MKITVLVDNNSRIDNYLLSQPALSLFIEADKKKILFDCGYSDVCAKNANTLNIDLSNLDDIVISHGHNDHTGGLKHLPSNKSTKFTGHPNIFDIKIDMDLTSYGCPISEAELADKFSLNLTRRPYRITDKLYFLGQIEGNSSDDIDDTCLAYKSSKGLIIISGCAHAGIDNIINHAKKVTKCDKIHTIFGGLHLLNKNEQELEQIADKFIQEEINTLYPCHCTDLKSKIILSRHLEIQEVCTGDIFEF